MGVSRDTKQPLGFASRHPQLALADAIQVPNAFEVNAIAVAI